MLYILVLATSCQSSSKKNDAHHMASSEEYQAQIKSDKKKQAELDLPFRGFNNDKAIRIVAFGSAATNCWTSIEKNKPDLMILTSTPPKELSKVPEYRSVREKVPFMCTPNTEGKSEFIKDWPYAKYIIPQNADGIYHSKTFGTKKNQIQVIMIDRFNNEQKWAWLESEFKKPTALKILTSPTQEREKLFNLIVKTKVKNLILLPNDRPIATFEKTEIKNHGYVYEAFTLNGTSAKESEPMNFGVIKIDWSNRLAELEIRTINDEKVQVLALKF